jgi:integrase
VRGVLSQIVEFAVESGALRANPTRRLKVPGNSSREMLFLNAGQVRQLADATETIQDGAGALVYVLAYSGLRWGEAVALRRGRCDILRGKLDIREAVFEVKGELYFGSPKTHQSRTVVLPSPVRDLLAAHMSVGRSADVDALVFTDSAGGPLRNSNWRRRVWKPACEAAGMPGGLRIHDLRHTAASLMVSTGANVKAVQRQLGHAKASMTLDRYPHLFTDDLEAMAERLEAVFNEGKKYSASTGRSDDLVELVV